jgi:hypothetical protein
LVLAGLRVDKGDEKLGIVAFYGGALSERVGGRSSQNIASDVGGGSLLDDDRPVVKGTWARGSIRKGQRGGS